MRFTSYEREAQALEQALKADEAWLREQEAQEMAEYEELLDADSETGGES